MKIKFILLICSFTAFFTVSAQSFSVKGKVLDEKNGMLVHAKVELLRPIDSSVLKGGFTNMKGEFNLTEINKGFYLLKISYPGYENAFLKAEVFNDIYFPETTILPEAQVMQGARATTSTKPVTQKGDTSEYRAGAYKTNPDANAEDLVNKMPGVTNTNGKVQVQGEDVKTVLVDGKPFFGDDPAAALKNLPADAIDKIQVFDQKSTQSQFTGFDDGNTSKTINIITKAQYKNGIFGKVSGGYGYDDKWRGTASINAFKNERKISLLFNSNNINEQNFSADDLLGVTSSNSSGGGTQGSRGSGSTGGGNRGGSNQSGGPQNASDNFLTNSKNGLVTTQAFGLNYTNKWKKLTLTGSYFYNYSNSKALSNLYRTYITGYSEGLLYLEGSQTITKNINQRFNLKLDWTIDSFNSITIQPKISTQKSNVEQIYYGENTYNSIELSRLVNLISSDQKGMNFSAPILFRHTFYKKGRTLSINTTPGYSQSNGSNKLVSMVLFSDTLSNDTLNQMTNMSKDGLTMSSNIVFSEPVSKNAQILVNYTGNLNYNNSDKLTNQYIPTEKAYNKFDTILSNSFKSRYEAHAAGINYNYKKDKLNFSFGGNYQSASLFVNSIYPTSYTSTSPFISFLPTAMVQYKYTQQKNIRLFYRTSNNIPSIDQLQDIINNNNPVQLTSGNSALKQDYQSNLNIRYSAANTKKSTSFFAVISGTSTKNFIANSVFIASSDTILDNKILLGKGSQISKPENLNGYYNLRTFSNYSFVIRKIKSNVNINGFGSIVKTPSRINTDVNFAYSNNLGLGMSLSSNISKDLDFTFSYNANYNTISNTLQEQLNSAYFNQNIKFKIQALLWKGLVLQTDISRQFYNGLAKSVNTDYTLWNAGIGYKFLKNRQAEFRLVVFDLLKQNASVGRNTTETYYEDVKTNIIQRYFMLNLTYNIKYFKQSKLSKKSK